MTQLENALHSLEHIKECIEITYGDDALLKWIQYVESCIKDAKSVYEIDLKKEIVS